ERQAHVAERPQQRNDGVEQDDGADQDDDHDVDDGGERLGDRHQRGELEPRPVEEAAYQHHDDQLDDKVGHGVPTTRRVESSHCREAILKSGEKAAWKKGAVFWREDNTAFISIAFTWHCHEARYIALHCLERGYKVKLGGPGVFTQKKFFADLPIELGGNIDDV